nr:hypothetical protein [Streptomyces hirsutus]
MRAAAILSAFSTMVLATSANISGLPEKWYEIIPVLLSWAWREILVNDAFAYPDSASVSIAASTICARRAFCVKVRLFGLAVLAIMASD